MRDQCDTFSKITKSKRFAILNSALSDGLAIVLAREICIVFHLCKEQY